MEGLCCVKTEIDITCRTSVPVVKPRALGTRIIEDIDQETIRSISRNFDINFLPR